MFIYTNACRKLRKLTKRKKIVQGGTSASKTYSILAILADKAIKTPGLEISVVSESIPHLRRGALKDFLKLLQDLNRYQDSQYNKSLLKYTFSNGSYIEFFSVDQPDKLRGARRNILFLNEANNIHHEAYNQLAIRTDGEIWIDYNPTSSFWAHNELIGQPDVDFIKLTYKDNEALSETIVKDIESAKEKAKTSKYWANWWRVYGLGEVGILEGVCIPEWEEISELPKDEEGNLECRLLSYGLDFGYTNDPSSLVGLYKWNDAYIFDEEFYKKGMLNSHISSTITSLEING